MQTAFNYALMLHQNEEKRFEFQPFVDVVNTSDAFKLSRISKSLFLPPCFSHVFCLALHCLEICIKEIRNINMLLFSWKKKEKMAENEFMELMKMQKKRKE
jgi:hypothetical protein